MTPNPTTPSRPSLLRSLSSTSSIPKTNKPRLYIALYPRGGSSSSFTSCHSCDSHHWSLIVGPQTSSRTDPGTRYHLAHATTPTSSKTLPNSSSHRPSTATAPNLLYEETPLSPHNPSTTTLLIRITLAKVTNPALLTTILRSIPIPSSTSTGTITTTTIDPTYTCYTFIRTAYFLLLSSGCLKTYLSASDWPDIERCARKYCKKKRDQRRFAPQPQPQPLNNDDGVALPRWDVGCVSTFNFWENRETTA